MPEHCERSDGEDVGRLWVAQVRGWDLDMYLGDALREHGFGIWKVREFSSFDFCLGDGVPFFEEFYIYGAVKGVVVWA